MVRFTLPRDLYHGKGALEALKTLKGKKAIICVGGGSMKRFGFLQRAEDYLKEAGMEVKLFEGIESDPSVDTVMKGAKVMEEYQPDWIVAIGGGSPIDAAKAMWIKYEYPDTTFEDMCKVFGLPKLRTKAHFCAVSSTSGTATEVTAFSVITDYEKGIKYPLADFEITPDVAVGVLMSALFLIFMDQILALIGASAETWDYARTYLTIVSFSGPFVLIANCYSNVIRAEGQSGKAMMGQLLGNLLNVILDPIMILVFSWNIAGAAIATVIGNVVGAGYYIVYFLKGSSSLSISLKDFSVKEKVASGVLAIGIPATLGNLLMSLSSILMNSQMAKYGDMAVAGVGVAMKVTMMTGMVCIGLGQGVQPLLGYCVGAKNWERYRSALKFSLIFAFSLSTVLTLICYLFTGQIVSVFLTDAAAYDYGVSFAHILLCTSFLFGVFYVLVNALQARGAATESLIVNISRQGLIYIPAMLILGAFFHETGLIWAQPVADVLSLVLSIGLYFRISDKRND